MWALRAAVAASLILVALCAPVPVTPELPFGHWALLPPAIALAVVLLSQRIIAALLSAVLVGSVIQAAGPFGVVDGLRRYFLDNLVAPHRLCVFGFSACMLGAVEAMRTSGGTDAVVSWVRQTLDSRRKVKLGAAFSGILIFFDDYANSMIIGPTFQSLTDGYRISREKLAYIVDSTAAPVAGLSLLSTWVAYEISVLDDALVQTGLEQGAYALLVQALPLRFYCLFSLLLVFLICWSERDFGSMRSAELAALAETRVSVPPRAEVTGKKRDFVVPIFALFVAVALGLFIDGGGLPRALAEPAALLHASFWRTTLSSVTHSVVVLFLSSALTAGLAICIPLLRTKGSGAILRNQTRAFRRGARSSFFPMLVLLHAWAIGAVCTDLHTGESIALLISQGLPDVLVPVVTFLAAALVSFMTGTSWGTMAILVPAAVPLGHATGDPALLVLTVAAVLDGAIFGDHCSPISDTTIMSATCSGCSNLTHVRTQLPYALLAMVFAALAGYLAVASGLAPWLAYLLGTGALWGSLCLLAAPLPRTAPGSTGSQPLRNGL